MRDRTRRSVMAKLVPNSNRSDRRMSLAHLSPKDMLAWFDRLVHIEVDGRYVIPTEHPVTNAIAAIYRSLLDELLYNWLVARGDLSKSRPAKHSNGKRAEP